IARIRQRDIFLILARASFTLKGMNDQYEDGVRENPLTLIMLTFQYFIISGMIIYWSNESFFSTNSPQYYLLLLGPVILLLYQLIIITIVGAITGNSNIRSEVVFLSLYLVQICGLFLLTLFLFIYFQPQYSMNAKWLIVSTFLFFIS